MGIEDDDEIMKLLEKKRESLLNKLKKAEKEKDKQKNVFVKDQMTHKNRIHKFLSIGALNYMKKKKKEDPTSYNGILTAVGFLIEEGLVEPKISLDAILFIAKRLMLEESKIFIDRKGRLEEV
ncbi:MAG: hypothetical protein ACTSVW_02235 [Candidatus Njordarchaeales archaeon]